ncbi:hypothetical protein CVT25_013299 [Psilocybe cyanescens]|uniref:Uncharacterized protein n=1 Tax=Psilocybe cyanescens TaxID=93625 RepID=A0A409XSG3_PSICY|nr:hypothetical protein CVT25_013299 [Psilocybe cyanescens]
MAAPPPIKIKMLKPMLHKHFTPFNLWHPVVVRGLTYLQALGLDPSGTLAMSTNEPLGVHNRDTSGSSGPALQEINAQLTSCNSSEPNGDSSDTNANDQLGELQRIREERDRLLAEVQSLRIQYDTSHPNQPMTQPALIPRPEGRRIKLQEDMGLANDRIRFLSIRRTIKDVLNRAGLDYMVHWAHQDKNKLAKIFHLRTIKDVLNRAGLDYMVHWAHQDKNKLAKIFHLARDRQPYLKRFAHNWPIEEYIKRHHKHIRAYHRRIANDGTNATIPNASSDEILDSQGEVPFDPDMYLDDL